MKAFEEWFETEKECYPYWPDEAASLAWKAALEWIKEESFMDDGCLNYMVDIDDLKEELEDE